MDSLMLVMAKLIKTAGATPSASYNSNTSTAAGFAGNVKWIIQSVLSPVLTVIGAAGVVYAIILGVNYIKAETPDKRKEAQSRLINAIIGVVIIIAGIVLCNAVDWGKLASGSFFSSTTTTPTTMIIIIIIALKMITIT